MKTRSVAGLFVASSLFAHSQNLIPDGGFNQPGTWVINNPDGGIFRVAGTVNDNNPWPTAGPFGPDALPDVALAVNGSSGISPGSATSSAFDLTQGGQYVFSIDILEEREPAPESVAFDWAAMSFDIVDASGNVARHLMTVSGNPEFNDLDTTHPELTNIPWITDPHSPEHPTPLGYKIYQIPFALSNPTGAFKLKISVTGTPDNGWYNYDIDRAYIGAVPEPSSLMLLGASCLGLMIRLRPGRRG